MYNGKCSFSLIFSNWT